MGKFYNNARFERALDFISEEHIDSLTQVGLESGYFDTASELKPLLHTWSLGVEEQFYLFWPLMVFGLWKILPRVSWVVIFAVLTVMGLAISEWMLRANPSAAFFLLPARFFEFSFGALFAFAGRSAVWGRISRPSLNTVIAVVSLAVLIATIVLYKGDTPFPGMHAILPCLATGGLLLAGTGSGTPVAKLLSNRVMVWIGGVSYSLYLVHWPVVALMRYKVGLHLGWHHQAIASGLMLLLTLLLYYGVERRISARAGQGKAPKDAVAANDSAPRKSVSPARFALGMLVAAVGLSGVFAHASMNEGWSWRFPTLSFTPEQIQAGKRARFEPFRRHCQLINYPDHEFCNPDADIKILTFGNSHEADALNFLDDIIGEDGNVELVIFNSTNNCKLTESADGRWTATVPDCAARMAILMDSKFMSQFDIIAYSSNKPYAANKPQELAILTRVKRDNPSIKLLTFGGFFNTEFECAKLINESGRADACFQRDNLNYNPFDEPREPYHDDFMAITDLLIDRTNLVCRDKTPESCEFQAPSGAPATWDGNHVSLDYTQMLAQRYAAQNPDFIRKLVAK